MTTKDEVKALWKLCFNDSDEFTDMYFSRRYHDEITTTVREDGRIISALQMIPYPMTFCGEVIDTSYISGACTHPHYRAHGAMRRLLNETHRRMYQDGVLLSTLIPAEEWLFGYYARSGYTPAFGYAVKLMQKEQLHPSADCRTEVCCSPGAEHYHYLDRQLRRRISCILHSEEDFRIIMADLKLSDGRLLVARKENRIVGMAFIVRGGDTVYIKELLADDEAVEETLLYQSAHIYNVRAIESFVPSSSDTLFLGMARVIDVERMLGLFARKYSEAELYIHLEDDDVISENNGYYKVKDGVCQKGQLSGKNYHTYTLGRLTRLLLEAEQPYMSLMLN